ncbi:pyridoxamine 5'-phosphate oxidase family protein [Chelatococcus sp. SYSU_G07232]|uniref:Pyridoxamine 5'-phosphate oxidase family protein n=1 Tax=Chelatococcus albus TaxID=3047466 RepID=A0ABT7AKN7_9HYPH|nr:pyridoxamine 5'-phosphate oxidase family protein [Chelatococcus sp. SYSU_G07232]MDJ1159547.1 pyridoxamine 5'-phosphate oxidase family protein [Chelatococcus sp. SYSU_G07232]
MSQPLTPKAAPAPLPGWPHAGSPFHAGERAVQERAGVRDRVERIGRRVVRDFMPDQHRELFGELPFLIVGSLDAERRPWASILVGRPGFVASPDARTLVITATAAFGDPGRENLAAGRPVGLLGIELQTRRRNRMNGTIVEAEPGRLTVRVGQSFGNCPQYIQAREPTFVAEPSTVAASRPVRAEGPLLSAEAAALVANADTFFIATASPEARGGDPVEGVDVSHRGGRPDFVRVSEEDGRTLLTSPDFVGNFHFNTFGNLAVNPRAGLLFVDFATGRLLSLTGEAEVVWEGPDLAAFAGAERLLRFRVTEGVAIEGAVPLRWSEPALARELPATGSWDAVAQTLAADALRDAYRRFTVTRIEDESETVRSFYLEPADGGGLAGHRPGQFLPIALDIAGEPRPVRRTYTLSEEANGRHYRISVKRAGTGALASTWLHDTVGPGTTVRAMAPRGDFTLDPDSRRPVVLISGGVGITPTIAMLDHLLGGTEDRMRYPGRRVWSIHAARHGGEHAFAAHVRALATRRSTLAVHVRYSAPRAGDVLGRDHDSVGRIDAELLKGLLPLDDYDFYLCGPQGFMQSVYNMLLGLGVRDERIRHEAFGPARLERRGPAAVAAQVLPPAVEAAVTFEASGVAAAWDPSRGSLLDLAEAAGIDAPWSCRSGTCGTCAVRLVAGAVTYAAAPSASPGEGEALLCCALPASARLTLAL